MREPLCRLKAAFSMDLTVFYRFPVLEGVLAVFLVLAFGVAADPTGWDSGISLTSDANWNEQLEYYLDYAQLQSLRAVSLTYTLAQFILAFAIPMMIAFNLAISIQNGLIETALTYPVSRRMLLLVKSLLVVLVYGSIATLVPIGASCVLIPGPKEWTAILSLVATTWVYVLFTVSTTALIAVLSRSAAITAVGGVGVQLGSLLLGMSSQAPMVRGLLSPVLAVSEFVLGSAGIPVTASELAVMILALSGISILLLVASVLIFERMDV